MGIWKPNSGRRTRAKALTAITRFCRWAIDAGQLQRNPAHQIKRPTGRRAHLVLDEAHALLHSEARARTMQTIFRIGRSLQFKATVITQSLDNLDGSEQTRVLLENAKTKLVLGLNQDSSAITRAASLLGLNEQEEAYLATCRMVKGVGSTALLLADAERTPLMIPMWPETIHEIVTGPSPRGKR